MHLIILDSTGGRHEAILLAASGTCMRIVIRGVPDTVELRRAGRGWRCEEGEPVELESLAAGYDWSVFCRQMGPQVFTAGSSGMTS
ncbi:MAG: hypothetical protein C5B51_15965 [Terriglobia bacterium]|nr:MAG: hypothetical protein C5B51_15965 [Terriglobia bacterium]